MGVDRYILQRMGRLEIALGVDLCAINHLQERLNHDEVCWCYSIIFLNMTPIFDGCVVATWLASDEKQG